MADSVYKVIELVGTSKDSWEKAAVNAVEHGATFDDEIALLVVHGILHLLGMDHEVDEEAGRMERREQQLLDRFYRQAPLPGPPS